MYPGATTHPGATTYPGVPMRLNLNAQTAVRGGLSPGFVPAISDGHMFVNNLRRSLRFRNAGASPVTVTVRRRAMDGDTVAGKAILLSAASDVEAGFWPASYNQDDGRVWWDYSDPTGVSVAVIDFEVV